MTTNNDPARSALAAFVSACGGNPPDWLREEHAAAEDALAFETGETAHAVALRQIRGLATWHSAKAKGEIYRIATEALGGHGGEPCGNSPWDALEAAQFWLQEEAASAHPGQTKPDEILRVIGDALAGRPASPPSVADVLARAEAFVAGFEDDDMQEGIPELLRDLRAAQGKEG